MPVLTPTGGVINDLTRGALIEGDGRVADSSYGLWTGTTNIDAFGGGEDGSTTSWTGTLTITNPASPTQVKFGLRAWKLVSTSGLQTADKAATGVALTAYTESIWFYREETTAAITVAVRNRLDTANLVSATLATTTGWQRIQLPFTTEASQTSIVTRISVSITTVTLWVDGVQIEAGTIATPYIETNGSTAARTAGYLECPSSGVLNATQGWVAARLRPGWAWNADPLGGNRPQMWSWMVDGSNKLQAEYDPAADFWSFTRVSGGSGSSATTTSGSFTAGSSHTLTSTWTATLTAISLDGASFGAGTANTQIPAGLPATWVIGARQIGAPPDRQFDGDFLWLIAGSGTLSDADAATIHGFGDTDPDISLIPGAVTMFWAATSDDYFTPASATTLMSKQMVAAFSYR
jgi:hypothetical protein